MKLTSLLISILLLASCNMSSKRLNTEKNMAQKDSINKNEVYQAVINFEETFKENGKQIFYTKDSGFEWFIS